MCYDPYSFVYTDVISFFVAPLFLRSELHCGPTGPIVGMVTAFSLSCGLLPWWLVRIMCIWEFIMPTFGGNGPFELDDSDDDVEVISVEPRDDFRHTSGSGYVISTAYSGMSATMSSWLSFAGRCQVLTPREVADLAIGTSLQICTIAVYVGAVLLLKAWYQGRQSLP